MSVSESKNFSREELQCSFSGECELEEDALNRLQALRDEWGKPIKLSSAYRAAHHPRERTKPNGPGYHHGKNGNGGQAFDVLIAGEDVIPFIALAIKHGFKGIGVCQSPKTEWNQRFIHIDTREKFACWSY
jgi:zinc D-Ala-D-Ala carboxypeptidase